MGVPPTVVSTFQNTSPTTPGQTTFVINGQAASALVPPVGTAVGVVNGGLAPYAPTQPLYSPAGVGTKGLGVGAIPTPNGYVLPVPGQVTSTSIQSGFALPVPGATSVGAITNPNAQTQ